MRITVHGIPAPQGSKRHVGNGRMIESSAKVKPWREAVKWAVIDQGPARMATGAVVVDVTFYLPRPQGHYGTGRNACTLRPSAPEYPAVKPDIDKLLRSTLDGLGDVGVWADDSRVVHVRASKAYADDRPAGADITIEPLP